LHFLTMASNVLRLKEVACKAIWAKQSEAF